MQVWFGLAKLGDPYPLYSVSNLGSIGALLTYPILIEPNLAVTQTTIFWFWSYLALVLCVVTCATIVRQRIKNSQKQFCKTQSTLTISLCRSKTIFTVDILQRDGFSHSLVLFKLYNQRYIAYAAAMGSATKHLFTHICFGIQQSTFLSKNLFSKNLALVFCYRDSFHAMATHYQSDFKFTDNI